MTRTREEPSVVLREIIWGDRDRKPFWQIGLVGALLAIGISQPTMAQLVPDNTLGAEESVVSSQINVQGLPAELIEGGATRGANLFHSFSEFNIGEGQRVYFDNPVQIETILSRVTGSNLSEILGTLGVNGGADLFFLNPNGIIFGPNVQLDIAGSFVASTADSLVFGNGLEFSATNPAAPPLLTVNVTPGLQHNLNNIGATVANTGTLAVGQDLTLSAGNLGLQGQLGAGENLTLQALDTVQIRDTALVPFIAAAGGQLLVQGNENVDIFALNHPNSGLFSGGDMVLRSASPVGGDAHYFAGGDFRVEQLDGSLGNLLSPQDPIIRSMGDVSFDIFLGTSLHILAGGSVTIGAIGITGPETTTEGIDFIVEEITLSNGTRIAIDGSARPTLDIRAGIELAEIGSPLGTSGVNFPSDRFLDSLGLPDSPPDNNPVASSADINVGSIALLGSEAANGQVLLTNQYRPNTSLAGDIIVGTIVTADDPSGSLSVELLDFLASIDLLDGFSGNSGEVIIDSRNDIEVTDSIDTSSSSGNAGNITLIAREESLLAGSFVLSETSGAGNAGTIALEADIVRVVDGAQISVDTFGVGEGGQFNITARLIEVIASEIFATTEGTGNAGEIVIDTENLNVTDGGQILVDTLDAGEGGQLNITAKSVAIFGTNAVGDPSALFADVDEGASGDGGNIIIDTDSFLVADGAEVAAGTFSSGNSGEIIITAKSVAIVGTDVDGFPSALFADVVEGASGDGGEINITAQSVEIVGGIVSTSAGVATIGNGGNINIDADSLLITEEGLITTSGNAIGDAGDLTIRTESVELIGNSDSENIVDLFILGSLTLDRFSGLITTQTGEGDGGNLTIVTGQLTVQGEATIASSIFGEGQGGNISVTASESVELNNASLGSGTVSLGDSGDIAINTDQLIVRDGAVIFAATLGEGTAGSIAVTADTVELSNTPANSLVATGIVANSLNGATGAAGDITINTKQLIVRDGAEVTVSSPQGQAGNVDITANNVSLDRGKITAETGVSQEEGGANINLQVSDFLILENESLISATATGNANGGNVTINTQFLMALPPTGPNGSDIIANAEFGNGGEITITASGIFGIEPRRALPGNQTNDIDASSEFGSSGTVQISQEIDPDQGLVTLPEQPGIPRPLEGCQAVGNQGTSSFINAGRGGLRPNPYQPLSNSDILGDVQPPPTQETQTTANGITEAQGWAIAETGQVVLMTRVPTANSPIRCGLH